MGFMCVSQNTSLTNSVYLNYLYRLSLSVTEHQSYQQYLSSYTHLTLPTTAEV